MLRVQARPSSGDSEDIDAAGEIKFWKWADFNRFLICTARDDLAKLQRQYRVTEGSRKQYAELSQNTLRKQQWDRHTYHTHTTHTTVEPLLKDPLAKGHYIKYLSTGDSTLVTKIQFLMWSIVNCTSE